MSDVLGRLLPAFRDVRTPLALGYSLMLLAWATVSVVSDGDPADDPVASLYLDITDELPAVIEFGAVTFVALLVGSGLVRLIDRFMLMTRTRRADRHNPLDFGTPLARRNEKGQDRRLPSMFRWVHRKLDPGWEDDPWAQDFLGEYAAGEGLTWVGANPKYDPERDNFHFHLQQDQEFGALEAEQLMRAVMLVPVGLGAALSTVWLGTELAAGDWHWSVALLALGLWSLCVILRLDYGRIGSLMTARWTALASEYPTWLPIEYQTHRITSAAAIEQSALKALDRVHDAWRDIVVADVQRRKWLRDGNDDESEVVGALTSLGHQLSNLGVLPLGPEVSAKIAAANAASQEFASSVRGDSTASRNARHRVGDALVELTTVVSRRLDDLMERNLVSAGQDSGRTADASHERDRGPA